MATAIAQAGDLDRAARLAARAESVVQAVTWSRAQTDAVMEVVAATAQAGDLDRAEALASTISEPGDQAQALIGIATAAACGGNLDRAGHLLARAMIIDPLNIAWVTTASLFFPSAMGGLWDIVAAGYTTRV